MHSEVFRGEMLGSLKLERKRKGERSDTGGSREGGNSGMGPGLRQKTLIQSRNQVLRQVCRKEKFPRCPRAKRTSIQDRETLF